MNNPNKSFGVMKKILEPSKNRNSSRKMRINPRKIRKILGRVWTAPTRILKPFCTQEALDASA
jgi:hypothetical protein